MVLPRLGYQDYWSAFIVTLFNPSESNYCPHHYYPLIKIFTHFLEHFKMNKNMLECAWLHSWGQFLLYEWRSFILCYQSLLQDRLWYTHIYRLPSTRVIRACSLWSVCMATLHWVVVRWIIYWSIMIFLLPVVMGNRIPPPCALCSSKWRLNELEREQ